MPSRPPKIRAGALRAAVVPPDPKSTGQTGLAPSSAVPSSGNPRCTRLTYRGRTRTLQEWADLTGVPMNALYKRVYKGWSPERVIETPHRPRGRALSPGEPCTLEGETRTVAEWAKLRGLAFSTVRTRVRQGMLLSEALVPTARMPGFRRHLVEHGGECLSLADWSRRTGIPAYAISLRLRGGWSVARALTTPCESRERTAIAYNGVTYSRNGWAKLLGVGPETLARRLASGTPLRTALFGHVLVGDRLSPSESSRRVAKRLSELARLRDAGVFPESEHDRERARIISLL